MDTAEAAREELPRACSKSSMKSSSDPLQRDLIGTVGSAVGSVWLLLPLWLLVVAVAGFVPAWVSQDFRDPDSWFLIWVVELGMSAMTIVGLLPLVLHWWFLRSMLAGEDVGWNLWRSFVNQVLTGSMILGIDSSEGFEARKGALATAMVAIAVGVSLIRRAMLKRLEREMGIDA